MWGGGAYFIERSRKHEGLVESSIWPHVFEVAVGMRNT